MEIQVALTGNHPAATPQVLFDGLLCPVTTFESMGSIRHVFFDCVSQRLGFDTPTVLIADSQVLEQPELEVRYLPGDNLAASKFVDSAKGATPLVSEWFGTARERAKFADLPYSDAAPFESGVFLLTPLSTSDPKLAGLAATHQLTHASFLSFRPWIDEGLAHFAQVLFLEQQKGRPAALDYMSLHRAALTKIGSTTTALDSEREKRNSLVNTINEQLYRSKSMCVWWMLRDMIGDAALKKSIAAYKPEQDNDPTYMPRLIAAQTQRDLGWFFDDWLYHDRGLPDFKVESAYAASTPTKSFLLAFTLSNLGTAGAEVPVVIKFAGGEVTRRIEVRAKSKATFRVETPAVPQEIRVNDGSVPESKPGNNVFKVDPPKS
jgi:hypothetical protein